MPDARCLRWVSALAPKKPQVEEQVMPYHARLLQQALLDAPHEGWDRVYVLGEDDMDAVIRVDTR